MEIDPLLRRLTENFVERTMKYIFRYVAWEHDDSWLDIYQHIREEIRRHELSDDLQPYAELVQFDGRFQEVYDFDPNILAKIISDK